MQIISPFTMVGVTKSGGRVRNHHDVPWPTCCYQANCFFQRSQFFWTAI